MIQGPLGQIVIEQTKNDPMCIKPEDLVQASQESSLRSIRSSVV